MASSLLSLKKSGSGGTRKRVEPFMAGGMGKGKLLNPADMEKKFVDYSKAKARQKPAWFWEYLTPDLRRGDDGMPLQLSLHCNLCFKVFSASNPSRTAVEHLKEGACKGISNNREALRQGGLVLKPKPASNKPRGTKLPKMKKRMRVSGKGMYEDGAEEVEAEVDASIPSPSYTVNNVLKPDVVERPQQLNQAMWQGKGNVGQATPLLGRNPTALVLGQQPPQQAPSLLPQQAPPGVQATNKGQKEKALMLLADWVYEAAGVVPLSSLEHPKFQEFLRTVGLPSLSHSQLAMDRLDQRYLQVKSAVDSKVAEAPFFQLATCGWSDREGGGDDHGLVRISLNLSSGSHVFRKVISVDNFPASAEFVQERLEDVLVEILGGAGEQDWGRCVGIVTDGGAAQRVAAERLSDAYPQMVNVTCQAQAFRDLLQDFREFIPSFHHAIEGSNRAINFFMQHPMAKQMLLEVYHQFFPEAKGLRMMKEAGVGNALECVEAVLACKEAVQFLVDDSRFVETFPDEAEDMQAIFGHTTDFWVEAEFALALAQPIRETIQCIEEEQPPLSQCLPMWNAARDRMKQWFDNSDLGEGQSEERDYRTLELFDRRFQDSYHPAWAVAYLLDPLYCVQHSDRCLPPFDTLTPEQRQDVDRLLPKLVAQEHIAQLMLELVKWRAEGLPYLYGEGLHKKERDPLTGKERGVSARTRTMIWETILGHLPNLGRVAARLMTLRATSGGPELHWNVWKWCGRGDIRSFNAVERAAKIALIASNARAEGKGPIDEDELMGELCFENTVSLNQQLVGYLPVGPSGNGLQQLVSGVCT